MRRDRALHAAESPPRALRHHLAGTPLVLARMDEPEANQSIRLLRDEARDLGVALRVVAVEEREHDGPVDTGRAGAARADEQGGFSITVHLSGTYLLGVRVSGFAEFRTA